MFADSWKMAVIPVSLKAIQYALCFNHRQPGCVEERSPGFGDARRRTIEVGPRISDGRETLPGFVAMNEQREVRNGQRRERDHAERARIRASIRSATSSSQASASASTSG